MQYILHKELPMEHDQDEIRHYIRKKYAAIATSVKTEGGGCCSGGCACGQSTPSIAETSVVLGYADTDMATIPEGANMGLGCGNPLTFALAKPGEVVLDMGSGGGIDCFIARRQVGETGSVIGVDMSAEMVELARKNLKKTGYSNIEFRLGEIEHLPVADGSVDVVISNCVVNLSLDKQQVFNETYRVLKAGGRLAISDIVATAELPVEMQEDLRMHAGCVAGAEHHLVIRHMLEESGFSAIRLYPKDSSKEILNNWVPDGNLEDYVASYMIEATKA